jgi:hypothetical protein
VTCHILTRSKGPLYAITIYEPSDFRHWRVEARNRVDYLRRVDARWRSFGIHVWLQRNATLQGVVTLGALGPAEVVKGLARWGAVLGAEITPEDLRAAIWSATKPRVISLAVGRARYQGLKLNIWPRRKPTRSTISRQPSPECHAHDPMPVLI